MTKFYTVVFLLIVPLIFTACTGAAMTESPAISTSPLEALASPLETSTSEMAEKALKPYKDNPVLTRGASGSWDVEGIFGGHVVFHDKLYHMFYNGSSDPAFALVAVGYATSLDGLSFTKYASNPILEGDESGFDAIQVSDAVPMVEGDTWVLYYNAGAGSGPGKAIGRATAQSPSGPWSRARQPVLRTGSSDTWDPGFVVPQSVVSTDEGYGMYYVGGTGWAGDPSMIGLAFSPDGVVWTKYDNPDTTAPLFAESDPVLGPGPSGSWDADAIWGCTVVKSADGWEMFYSGKGAKGVQIGYATSSDGVHWDKHRDNPILAPLADPNARKNENPTIEAPSVVVNDSAYFVYYDYGLPVGDIGVAVGSPPTTP